ncbi:carbon-nitrogen hydrolase [Biscogniauxia mediterranea]|nr:carbon-nitrogen hydrolase [Biscogniauxia mediterranea]
MSQPPPPPTTTTRIRLATASPATQPSLPATLSLLRDVASRAAAQAADLLLLPEAFLGGYPRGSDFGCAVGGRTPAGRDAFREYFRAAVDLGDTVGEGGAGAGGRWVRRELESVRVAGEGGHGEEGEGGKIGEGKVERGDGTRETLEDIARQTGVFLVVGCVERAGGSLYCSVVYVCPRLGCVGKRRKVLPTASERLIWANGSPATLKAVSTVIRGVRINLAAAICWENYMPLLRQSLYAQNVNLYLAPTADNRDAWLALVRTVALEGRCFVVSSNMCVPPPSPPPAAGSGAGVGAGVGMGMAGQRTMRTMRRRSRRRSSVIDEDGNEIVLPDLASTATTTTTTNAVRPTLSTVSSDAVAGDDDDNPPPHPHPHHLPHPHPSRHHPTAAAAGGGERGEYISRGGSAIVSPSGEVLAGPQWEDPEGIIYADVDFEDCVRGRLDLDVAGSYSRNDSFKLTVEGLDFDPLPYY